MYKTSIFHGALFVSFLAKNAHECVIRALIDNGFKVTSLGEKGGSVIGTPGCWILALNVTCDEKLVKVTKTEAKKVNVLAKRLVTVAAGALEERSLTYYSIISYVISSDYHEMSHYWDAGNINVSKHPYR